ncbi:MinD/ParA family ATP-binding protein [Nocardia transvalensis]|uniref:MinD/ParA family ATP-binding protein n=1 Tax=Nocardia transvalensis TaxID=37333 RepID=UPI001894F8FA|nr:ParA family protein [Nocardia transvalensis]MBF6331460.1 ParA family protein [Nocardia transvalensis]
MTEHPTGTGDIAGEREDYTAERPVDLRRQRLRPAGSPDAAAQEPANTGRQAADSDAGQDISDPYGVGAENLEGSGPDAREVAAVREARLAMLRHPAPGVETDPAQWGWRGALNSLGLRLRPRRESAEVAYRHAVERIRQPLAGTPLVVVANPKGGTGVTPAVVLLSALFAQHRGGQVVAWDANEACGTLADRAAVSTGPETVWDVLGHARQLCSANADASGLARFLHRQPTLDEVLASDHAPGGSCCVGTEECAAIWAVLRRHRSLVVADTGNNDRAPAFRWAIEHATQLVVPVIGRRDAVVAALRLLDGIADDGHDELAAAAVVVLAAGGDSGMAAEALSTAGVQRVVGVPFDPVLASGERIVVPRLRRTTVAAWTEVAALVADGIADSFAHDQTPLESDFIPEPRWVANDLDSLTVKQRRMLAYALREGTAAFTGHFRAPATGERLSDPGR